jgi:hypothetical protein
MDKDVIYSEIEKRRKYYDGLKHSVELSKQEREIVLMVSKLLHVINSSSMQMVGEKRVYSSTASDKTVSVSFSQLIPDDIAFLHSLYLLVVVEKPIERFLDYITKNREIKNSSLIELQDILNSAKLDKEYDDFLCFGEENFKEKVRILEEIRLENEEKDNGKDQIRAWAQDKLATEYDIKNSVPTRLLSALELTNELIIILKSKDAIKSLSNTFMPYELDILKGILENEEVNQHIDFVISHKKGQDLEEKKKITAKGSAMERIDGNSFSLPDNFCDLKINSKDKSEYFSSPMIILTPENIESFINLINYVADNNYIENTIETKRTLVYRLTGRWRPEGDLAKIYWDDHSRSGLGLSLVYLVDYGFDKSLDKYDKMMEYFEVPKWLEKSQFPKRAMGAPSKFRRKLNGLFPEIFPLKENEKDFPKKL